ncbi:hypothetical protein ACP4OV_014967 [Aristida adscensionis]
MAAGSSCLVDDFYFSALAHGRSDGDDDDGELFPISDEKYATELQLQEVIMSSAVTATARSPSPPSSRRLCTADAIDNDAALALALVKGKDSCAAASSSSSSSSSSPPQASLAAAAELVFCKICMDAVPRAAAHRASRGCAHAFCGACLAGYVGAKIQDRIAGVRCPEEMCGGALDPELCQGLLPREVFERWCAALCEAMVLGAAGRTYCPYKDCSAMMVDDGGAAVAEAECPCCRRLFCARCGAAPWHAGVGCEEYGKLGKGDRGREDMMLLEMAKGKKWKRCPKCEFFVEKSDGCLHITCSVWLRVLLWMWNQVGDDSFWVQHGVK